MKVLPIPNPGFRISKYDHDLGVLNDLVCQLLRATRDAMTLACEALNERNVEKADFVVHNDDTIDHLELMVHKTASDLIMRYQPISNDLRQTSGALPGRATALCTLPTPRSLGRPLPGHSGN